MKRFGPWMVALVMLLVTPALPVAAGEAKYRFDPVTQSSRIVEFPATYEGFLVFNQLCKSCHTRDNGKGAPFIHQETYNRRAWNRIFLTRYPRCAQDGSWAKASQEDLLKLHDYLYTEARDSYNPYSYAGAC